MRPRCPRPNRSRTPCPGSYLLGIPIVPELRAGKNVLIVAHGNSLRALVKMLDMMSESEIVEFNIPTGIPILYELDEQLQSLGRRFLRRPAGHLGGSRRGAPPD